MTNLCALEMDVMWYQLIFSNTYPVQHSVLSNLCATDKRIKWECQACIIFIRTCVRANRTIRKLSVKAHLHA